MSNRKYTFSKIEKLKSRKEISRIFNNGIFFSSDIISVIYIKTNDIEQKLHKVGISVPKKLFKLAVTRNKIKRQIREAYRLNKSIVYKEKQDVYNLMFIYKNKEIMDYNTIQNNIIELLKKLSN